MKRATFYKDGNNHDEEIVHEGVIMKLLEVKDVPYRNGHYLIYQEKE